MDRDGIKIESNFVDDEGKYLNIELGGYVDQANVYHLQRVITDSLRAEIYNVIFDLKNLVYMSSAGWGVIIGEIKRFREQGGDIKLANMPLNIYEVYQMLEFYHIINDYPSVQEAYSSFLGRKTIKEIKKKSSSKEESSPMHSKDESNEDREINIVSGNGRTEDAETFVDRFSMDISDILEGTDDEVSQRDVNVKRVDYIPVALEDTANVTNLPLAEKVKKIVSQRPYVGLFQIKRILRHNDFGNTKVGLLKLRKLLKELDLDSKEKRFRFYRSC
jgi:anti-sigma B factor antagonist